jgi:hypothetical protein
VGVDPFVDPGPGGPSPTEAAVSRRLRPLHQSEGLAEDGYADPAGSVEVETAGI